MHNYLNHYLIKKESNILHAFGDQTNTE